MGEIAGMYYCDLSKKKKWGAEGHFFFFFFFFIMKFFSRDFAVILREIFMIFFISISGFTFDG